MTHDEFLEHVGILGMKWGHRKNPQTDPRHSLRISKRSEDYYKKYMEREQFLETGSIGLSRGEKFLAGFGLLMGAITIAHIIHG